MLHASIPPIPMNTPQYETNDPYLASFVLSQGAVLASCRRVGPKKVEFRFESNRRLHQSLRVYWSRLPVPVVPYHLYAALRMLKSRTLVQPGVVTRASSVRLRRGVPNLPTPDPEPGLLPTAPRATPETPECATDFRLLP